MLAGACQSFRYAQHAHRRTRNLRVTTRAGTPEHVNFHFDPLIYSAELWLRATGFDNEKFIFALDRCDETCGPTGDRCRDPINVATDYGALSLTTTGILTLLDVAALTWRNFLSAPNDCERVNRLRYALQEQFAAIFKPELLTRAHFPNGRRHGDLIGTRRST